MSAGFANLRRLLCPRTIAVVGGTAARRVAEQCGRMQFSGEVWPVHPSRRQVAGKPAFPSVTHLPGAPDAAFIGINRHAAIDAVAALSQRGAGGAVCYASGFLEAEDGAALQQALVAAAARMPLVGPNCYGLINFLDGAPLWPDQHGGQRLEANARGVAIVTQSSNIAISMTMQRRGLPIAYLATAGNQAQLGVADLAAGLLADERVSALGLHVEGFHCVRGFEALAQLARERRVAVVALKTGRSEQGRAATLSHTASVAGSDAGAEAFLRRLGFARVATIPAFLETLKLMHVHTPLDGHRIGSLSCSGGEASLIADAAAGTDLTLPPLAPDHAEAIAATTHPLVTVVNPLDYHTFSWGDEEALRRTFRAFAGGGFDASLLVLDYPREDRCDDADWRTTARAFAAAMQDAGQKGVAVATLSENMPEEHAAWLMARGIAPLGGVAEALTALDRSATIGAAWRSPPPQPALVCEAAAGEAVMLDEAEAKALLAQHGVCIPQGAVAETVEEAASIAAALAAPVAAKALGIAHKTECGAVRLGLRDAAAARAAAQPLFAIGSRLLVERQVEGIVAELLVGVQRDPQLGLLLTIGAGGQLVELLADTETLLLPTTAEEVRSALSRLRCYPLLRGHRGRPAADVGAATAAILAIADFAAAHRHTLEELDVNPLGLTAGTPGAVALDALIRTAQAPQTPERAP